MRGVKQVTYFFIRHWRTALLGYLTVIRNVNSAQANAKQNIEPEKILTIQPHFFSMAGQSTTRYLDALVDRQRVHVDSVDEGHLPVPLQAERHNQKKQLGQLVQECKKGLHLQTDQHHQSSNTAFFACYTQTNDLCDLPSQRVIKHADCIRLKAISLLGSLTSTYYGPSLSEPKLHLAMLTGLESVIDVIRQIKPADMNAIDYRLLSMAYHNIYQVHLTSYVFDSNYMDLAEISKMIAPALATVDKIPLAKRKVMDWYFIGSTAYDLYAIGEEKTYATCQPVLTAFGHIPENMRNTKTKTILHDIAPWCIPNHFAETTKIILPALAAGPLESGEHGQAQAVPAQQDKPLATVVGVAAGHEPDTISEMYPSFATIDEHPSIDHSDVILNAIKAHAGPVVGLVLMVAATAYLLHIRRSVDAQHKQLALLAAKLLAAEKDAIELKKQLLAQQDSKLQQGITERKQQKTQFKISAKKPTHLAFKELLLAEQEQNALLEQSKQYETLLKELKAQEEQLASKAQSIDQQELKFIKKKNKFDQRKAQLQADTIQLQHQQVDLEHKTALLAEKEASLTLQTKELAMEKSRLALLGCFPPGGPIVPASGQTPEQRPASSEASLPSLSL